MTHIRIATVQDCEQLAEVHVTAWRESYRGLVPQAVLDALSIEQRTESWRKAILENTCPIYLAEEHGRIIGFGQGGPCRGAELGRQMEVYAIYLLDRAKRRGIGSTLLTKIISDFLSAGANTAALWVLQENSSARSFYEHFGAQFFVERTVERGDWNRVEAGYVWNDLRLNFKI
jgi:L-amino acid N-acyltransferase YncA